MHLRSKLAILLFCVAPITTAVGDEAEDLLEVRNTVVNLLQSLVERGILTSEEAAAMVSKAQEDARAEIAREAPELREDDVRVTYVPEIVRDQIRAEVREELSDEVVAEVKRDAREEGWGVPAGLPAWLDSIEVFADTRLRFQGDYFGDDNAINTYLDFNAVNAAGGISLAGPDAFLNVSEDQNRLVGRVRFGARAQLSPNFSGVIRLNTGNLDNPVSPNFVFGQYKRKWDTGFDLAYLRWQPGVLPKWRQNLVVGRMENYWQWSNLIWDNDVTMEGIFYSLGQRDFENRRGVSAAVGYYPLKQIDFSSDDGYRASGQLMASVPIGNESWFALNTAYHHYDNITGVRNTPDSRLTDFTAPPSVQRGNTLFDIRNDLNPETNLFALAAEYHILNVTGIFNARFPTGHDLRLTADYVNNIGYDEEDIRDRVGFIVPKRGEAYQAELLLGMIDDRYAGDWAVSVGYRSVERDALLDAFTDSDFGGGGTDTEGYILGLFYNFLDDFWVRARYMSFDEIDGPPLSVDTLQIDFNARF